MHEYEEIGRGFKINGYNYNFNGESMKKFKFYGCNKRNSQKCRGSMKISPNRQIILMVGHTCSLSKNKNNQPKIISVGGYS